MTDAAVISVSELTRRFGAKTALHSVSIAVHRGAVYTIGTDNRMEIFHLRRRLTSP